MQRSIAEIINEHALQHGDSVAVSDGERTLTYRQLISRSVSLAAEVDALPASAWPIGIFLPGATSYVVSVLALLIAGRTAVPMNDSQPDERQRRIISTANLAAVIVDSTTAHTMRRIAPALRQLSPPTTDSSVRLVLSPRRPPSPDHVFSISFTSGSTGEPKGVCRSEQSLLSRFATFVPSLPLTSADRVPLLESINIGMSINLVLNALCAGARVDIIDMKQLGVRETIERLVAFRPTVFAMVSSTFQTLFATDLAGAADLARDVRWVRLGGDPVQHSDVKLYRRRFAPTSRLFVAIGASETGTFASWAIDHDTALDRPLVPVGYPERGVEIELRDDDGDAVSTGEVGEIIVTSPALALGYWCDEALTKARFTASARHAGIMSYRTGDFGRFLPNGLLECVGRRDRQVKIRGNTVHPGEVEAVLSRCPGVAQVGVVARTDVRGTTLAAYFTTVEGGVTEEQLRAWSRAHLNAPAQPAQFIRLDVMPVLPTGKLNLAALTALATPDVLDAKPEQLGSTTVAALSGDDLEDTVRHAWTTVLSASSFEADMPFDSAGGDSLKGLTLIVTLEAALGRVVPMGTLGTTTTPRDLINRLRESTNTTPLARNDRPHVVLFPGLWGDDIHTTDFFRGLAERFNVTTIDWRLGGDAMTGDFDGVRFVREAIETIRRIAPTPRLWLTGYSFGGRLAAEVARHLLDAGIPVEAVVILDGEAGRRVNPPSARDERTVMTRLRTVRLEHGGSLPALLHSVTFRIAVAAARRHIKWALRGAVSVVRRWGSNSSRRTMTREITRLARLEAFADLPSGFLPMPIVLLVTDESMRNQPRPDLGWASRCQQLHTIAVGGSHLTMLSLPTRNTVLAKLDELEVALRST